jgi:transposase
LLRSIDRFVDLSEVRSHLAPFYSSTGRPSIDPELLVRMLLVGYCYGIRSERRLCEEVHLNLAYRWFCRLGLDGEVPDHSTFSKNRHGRFRDGDLLRKLFETVVRSCMTEGLVDGAAFAVDASLIAADANKQRSAAGSDDVDWEAVATTRRSVREYLDTLDEAAWGAGKVLTSTGTLVNDGATLLYRASKYDCDTCELKSRCCSKMPARKVPRSIYENARDVARGIAKTETYVTSRRERKKIEMLFAHLKRILRLDRLRLREARPVLKTSSSSLPQPRTSESWQS